MQLISLKNNFGVRGKSKHYSLSMCVKWAQVCPSCQRTKSIREGCSSGEGELVYERFHRQRLGLEQGETVPGWRNSLWKGAGRKKAKNKAENQNAWKGARLWKTHAGVQVSCLFKWGLQATEVSQPCFPAWVLCTSQSALYLMASSAGVHHAVWLKPEGHKY